MKKLLILFFTLLSLQLPAQNKKQQNCGNLWPGTIIEHEYCWFDTLCSFIIIDTSNHNNIWKNGAPQKTNFSSALSFPNAMVTDTLNPYPINNDSYFDICVPLINTIFSGNLTLSFSHKINSDSMKDGGFIEVQYYKDSAWINAAYDTIGFPNYVVFNCLNLYGIDDTLINGQAGFSGNTDWISTKLQWIWMIPVKDYQPDTIRIRFHFISDDINTNKDGWMIDNMEFISTDLGGNIEENISEDLISVSPNPVSESAIVELKVQRNETYTAELYNVFGQKTAEFPGIKNNTFIIERGTHESGIKFLVVKNENKIIAIKKIIFL